MSRARPDEARQWVTPEHLNVAPEILGLPLAAPRRRAMAMLLDLAVVGIVSSFANVWLLGAAAAVGVAQALADRRRSPVPLWAWAGVAVLTLVGLQQAWVHRHDLNHEVGDAGAQAEAVSDAAEDNASADRAELRRRARALKQTARQMAAQGSTPNSAQLAQLASEVASAVAPAIAPAQRIAELEAQLTQARKPAPMRWWDQLKQWGDELGLGYGWAIVYFSLLPAWWRGQTVGKRLLGLRVVELTGKPMTAMHNLKRYGGYMAGMATGGIGLAQILWDPNRQGIQDKTAHTAVIDLRQPRRPPLPLASD